MVASKKTIILLFLLGTTAFAHSSDLLNSRVKDHLLDAFNQTDFSVAGSAQTSVGLSVDSLKTLEIFAGQTANKEVQALVSTFITKIGKQAIYTAGNKYSYYSQSLNDKDLSSAQLNYLVLRVLQKGGKIESLTKEQLVGLRNYFGQHAALSQTVQQALPALKGLSIVGSSIPAVRTQVNKVSITGSKGVKFDIVDSLGNALKNQKLTKVSLSDLSDGKSPKDITSQVKIDQATATWTFGDLAIGRYQLSFTFESGHSVAAVPAVTLTDSLAIQNVQYSLTTSSSIPRKFDHKLESTQGKITNLKQASDDHYMHVAVEAKFVRSASEKPTQVYLTLRKAGSLALSSQAKLNKETGLYEAAIDFSRDITVHLNGDYQLSVHAADYRAEPTSWTLGSIKVWYKEGHEEGSNTGIRPDYETLPVIEFVYPPEQTQISLLLPAIGTVGLAFFFLRYVSALLGNRANLSGLSFSGIIFLANLLLILFIFVAFFVEVKLIPTLWTLLFISPFTFFIAQRALSSADCTIGEFKAPVATAAAATSGKKKQE